MRIRWTGASVRYRITPPELDALKRKEALKEALTLGGEAAWVAEIVPAEVTSLRLTPSTVRFEVSDTDIARLSDPEAEGIYFQSDDRALRYYIEKDFPCAHPSPAEAAEATHETFEPPASRMS